MLRGSKTTRRVTWLTGLAAAAAIALAGCSSGATSSGSPAASSPSNANAAAAENPNLDLGTSLGGKAAPEISLVNQFGQHMSLSQFRGRVVMLGFEDSECTTICPLTTQSMVLA
ncbi:MAG: SCO family protein, partial [Trebonia sp.]